MVRSATRTSATRTRATTRQQYFGLLTALAGFVVAMWDVVRYTGGGRVGAALGRQPETAAVRSGQRVTIAPRLRRRRVPIPRRQPVEYVAAGVVAGVIGTVGFAALIRSVRARFDDGLDASSDSARAESRKPHRMGSARVVIDRLVPRRLPVGLRVLTALRRTEKNPEVTPIHTGDASSATVSAPRGQGAHEQGPSGNRSVWPAGDRNERSDA
jgi:hypothetical protein